MGSLPPIPLRPPRGATDLRSVFFTELGQKLGLRARLRGTLGGALEMVCFGEDAIDYRSLAGEIPRLIGQFAQEFDVG